MKILVLIFGVLSNHGQIELIKIPISEALSTKTMHNFESKATHLIDDKII